MTGMVRETGLTARLTALRRYRRLLRAAQIGIALVVLFGLFGFFGVPLLLRHLATGRLALMLDRPVSVGAIAFNPFRLRLEISQLHIGARDQPHPFADVGHLHVKAAWSSLLRLAPVITEVTVDRPAIHIVRVAVQRFNFSDLIEGRNPAPVATPAKASRPLHFALSNIRLNEGEVVFDDQVVKSRHTIEHIQIGIPFIANLPADVDIYVQPLLQMVIDGSPLRVTGKAKPFAGSRESVIDLDLDGLDLPHYAGYVPQRLPIKILRGTLSADLQVHFVQAQPRPLIRLGGSVELDQLEVRDAANAPLIGLKQLSAALTEVEPLENVVHLGKIKLDGLTSHVVLNRDGTINFASLAAATGHPQTPNAQDATIAAASNATMIAANATPAVATDLLVESFELSNGAVDFTDNSRAAPAALAMQSIHFGLENLRTGGQAPPAAFDAIASVKSGGSIAFKGLLDLANSKLTTDVGLDRIDLPALQPFMPPAVAAQVAAGKLGLQAKVETDFAAGKFNLHSEPASVWMDQFDLRVPGQSESPIGWNRLSASIGQIDLAAHQAKVKEVRADGLRLFVRRGRDGELSLASILRGSTPAPSQSGPASRGASTGPQGAAHGPPPQQWRYQIASVAVENTQAEIEDDTVKQPIKLVVAPLNLRLKDLESDFAKPIAIEADGNVNRQGAFKVAGDTTLAPLTANLHISTRRFDLTPAYAYVSDRLNTTITKAALSMNGAVGLSNVRNQLHVTYRGDATVGNVRMLDKVTGDVFASWKALSASAINAELGTGPPNVRIGGVALSDFYARVILNAKGRMNLFEVMSSPQAAPKSLTREQQAQGVQRRQPTRNAQELPASGASAVTAVRNEPSTTANMRLGRITFQDGHINYSDYFIKPNYSADLTQIAGFVGAFGTRTTRPADVELRGEVNGTAPIEISGSVNPLAPMASVDIKAKAHDVELIQLTPYSTKYTGYPITKGSLTFDIHYLLDKGTLTASNHIFLDQLTFGNHVESPNALNLPIRLAVALLKNAKGQIDLSVPISGSLSDPQFSLAGVVLHALMNVITKAVTSPFTLLASAAGGSGGGSSADDHSDYVAFAPGLAALTTQSQQRLDTLAKALQDRPALRLSISGRVDPAFDRDGLREAKLAEAIRAEKIKDLGKQDDNSVEIEPDEYDKYLKRAYKAAKFPKPTNVLGLNKSLPPDEMKKLMLAHTEVTDKDLRQLADSRAAAVMRWLSKKVDPSRLSVGEPKLNADGLKDKNTTRAELSLS